MLHINNLKFVVYERSERLRGNHGDDSKSTDGQPPQLFLYIKSDPKVFVKGNQNLIVDPDKEDML